MVTISPTLQDKIERRAKRAWRRRASGSPKRISRITNVTDDALTYRVPYTPDYYGKESVQVVLKDGGIVVDPPSTGLFDLLTKADVVLLRTKNHLGRVRAYKYTNKDAESPFQSPKLKYEPGKTYEIKDADTDPSSHCHKGVNVADVAWTMSSCSGDQRVFAFEFEMKDIAAIPTSTDGKFRLHRCICVEELDPKTFEPLKPVPKSPQDDLDDLIAPDEEPKIEATRVVLPVPERPKKRGLFERLLGWGNDRED
jgi:hypothetical protein